MSKKKKTNRKKTFFICTYEGKKYVITQRSLVGFCILVPYENRFDWKEKGINSIMVPYEDIKQTYIEETYIEE